MDSNFHTFHIHGHRWKDPAGAYVDNPSMGPNEIGHRALRRGQPGSLALPLPRLLPSGHGDDGLVRGRSLEERRSTIRTSLRIASVAVTAAALLAPAGANAQTYPEPKDPGKVEPKPKGPFETHTVCRKKGRCDFRTIQAAVNAADAGDTIRVRNGVYKEAVKINGRKKRYLKLIGNPRKPTKVVLEGSGKKQNGIFVNDADEVTVNGFKARHYRANGFFFTNLNGYTMNHLIAAKTGVYGLYAFNTIGGRIINSEAYYVNDGAFYIGQTPPQDNPIQTIVRNVDGWGSPIGFSATNMRYVTITKSRFYNNAIGIVPNALDSEKFPPPENNVIIDNDIFWNNFNFHKGHPPFKVRDRGHRGAGADRHRHPAARRARAPDREQPDLRQLPERRRRDRRHPAGRRTRRRSRSTATGSAATSSASAARTSTAATSPTTAAAATTASRSSAWA